MKIIGLLGGIAGGKSMVAEQFAALGAEVLNADKIGHEVLERPDIEAEIRRRWGDKVFGANGRIDRKRLAEVVFADRNSPQEREYLEHLTHPVIVGIIMGRLKTLSQSGMAAAVIDAPLLAEVGLDKICDTLVFVDARPEIREKRAIARGWKQDDFAAREGAQKSLDFKRAHADAIIDNSGSPEQTQAQVSRLWQTLVR